MEGDGTLTKTNALKNCGVVRNQNSKYQELTYTSII